ncbi:MAG: hypothetical protein CVV21_04200 [Candidatus Goldiibacteriota bacterium HGW-Goldbacteria-1]|nr:MAG: hypothetical protein CVV21_04200 [Candidatus Goldiibacteriota bacterium HGW-Goldbacteria-1]
MKKIIIVFMLLLPAFAFAVNEALVIPYGPGVYIGKEEVMTNTSTSYYAGIGDTVSSDTSVFGMYLKDGGCVRCAAGSSVLFRKANYSKKQKYTAMAVKKGKCYFNTGYAPGARLEINAGDLVYETGEAVLLTDADNNDGKLFYGAGIFYGRQKQMANLKLETPEVPDTQQPDFFDVINFTQDRVAFTLTISGQGVLPAKAAEVIKAGLSAEYSVEQAADDEEMAVSLNVSEDANYMAITGTVKDADGNILKIVDVKEGNIKFPLNEKMMVKAYITAVNEIISASRDFAAKTMAEGKRVIIEGDFGEPDKVQAVKELILSAPGVISAEDKVFYGKKAVYTVKCRNSGAGLAVFLEGKKAENGNISVWNSGKNIVKLRLR